MADTADKGPTAESMMERLLNGDLKELTTRASTENVDIALLSPSERLEVIEAETMEYNLSGPDSCYQRFFRDVVMYDYVNRHWYVWKENHWGKIGQEVIMSVIHNFAETYVVTEKKKKKKPYDSVRFFKEALDFTRIKCSRSPDFFNPHGFINVTNGVLEIKVENGVVIPVLHDHAPRFMMTQRPLFAYDPQAPTEDCDRFLTLLEDEDRDLAMRIAGTSLNPHAVAQQAHRVPFMLSHGPGSAGKDAWRRMVEDVVGGETTANISMTDFAVYEQGKGGRGCYNMTQLAGAKLCCDSETTRYRHLDKLEVLKKAITHNEIYVEGKFKDGARIRPYCVFIYNANNLPQLDSLGGEVVSRFVVVQFSNRYSTKPSDWKKGYLKADPLFTEDSTDKFRTVVPAFLNKMIAGLQLALSEGFNTEHALPRLEMMRVNTNHLARFADDSGMTMDLNSEEMTTTKDIAIQLCHWYVANDYAEFSCTSNQMELAKDPFQHLNFKPDADQNGDKVVRSLAHFGRRLQNLSSDIVIGRNKDKRSAVKGLKFENPLQLAEKQKQQAQPPKAKVPDWSPEQLEEARAWALKTGNSEFDYKPEEHSSGVAES